MFRIWIAVALLCLCLCSGVQSMIVRRCGVYSDNAFSPLSPKGSHTSCSFMAECFSSVLVPISSKSANERCTKHSRKAVALPNNVIYPTVYFKSHNGSGNVNVDLADYSDPVKHLYVKFSYEGRKHRLKLALNEHLSRRLQSSLAKGSTYKTSGGCFYQGYCVRRSSPHGSEDMVSLTACNQGLRGIIHIEGQPHSIEPYIAPSFEVTLAASNSTAADDDAPVYSSEADNCYPHLISKLPTPRDGWCGNLSGQWTSFDKLHKQEFSERMTSAESVGAQSSRDDHIRLDVDGGVEVKRNSDNSRYLSLAVVLDRAMMSRFDFNEDRALERLFEVTNMVDMYYQRLGLRVAFTYWEFWPDDRINISSSASQRETLQKFLTYTTSGEHMNARSSSGSYDVMQLISGKMYDDSNMTSSLAIPDSICTNRAVGVVSTRSHDAQRLASILSHLIGHNIGLTHDTRGCSCPDTQIGCIMSDTVGSGNPTHFSSCSHERMEFLTQAGLGICLTDEPFGSSYPQSCGNGFVERGEQCDCGGSEFECEKTDPCCDASTCLLKNWAQCSTGSCCLQCMAKPSNQVCRPARGPCDAEEYCDGVFGECPADAVIADGERCAEDSDDYCYGGKCPTRDAQCKAYWGEQATSASIVCYNYNRLDSVFGHCGWDVEGKPVSCADRDKFCGLLQCDGGSSYPVLPQLKYQTTSAGENGKEQYKCKTVQAPDSDDIYGVGLIHDGTMCAEGMMCINQKCQGRVTPMGHCPHSGLNNLTCSGNGRCTDIGTCYCYEGYQGNLCDQVLPTLSPGVGGDNSYSGDSSDNRSSTLDTKLLIIIICSVAGIVIIAMVIGLLFCRRRITTPKKQKTKQKSHLDDSSLSLSSDRTISFGQTPSYRNEKLGRKKRKRRRKQSSSDSGETDSDDKVDAAAASARRSPVAIPVELSRQPGRGILKNSSHTYGIKVDGDGDACSSNCSCSEQGDRCCGAESCSCSDSEERVVVELHEQPLSASIHRLSEQEDSGRGIAPPMEFDTSPYTRRKVKSADEREKSPTDSEEGKYCSATEADQYYRALQLPKSSAAVSSPSYNIYLADQVLHHNPLITSISANDSATDSAIDMPGDGSISTINEIPPSTSNYNGKQPAPRLSNQKTVSPGGDESDAQDTQQLIYERHVTTQPSAHRLGEKPAPPPASPARPPPYKDVSSPYRQPVANHNGPNNLNIMHQQQQPSPNRRNLQQPSAQMRQTQPITAENVVTV